MKVVSILNMKGGVAKTTLATNLADALARRMGKKVLLIDLDPQFNATQCLVAAEEYVANRESGAPTILNIFDDTPPIRVSAVSSASKTQSNKLEEIEPWSIRDGFDLLPGDLELYRLDMGAGQGREFLVRRYLEAIKAASKYDYVIIDTPPTPSHWMTAALLASDGYLVPVKPEPLSRTGIDLLKGVVERSSANYSHPIKCYGVVLTIVETNTKVYSEAIAFLDSNPIWKGKRLKSYLVKRTGLAAGQGNQQMILDMNDEQLKLGLVGVTQEFLERVSNG